MRQIVITTLFLNCLICFCPLKSLSASSTITFISATQKSMSKGISEEQALATKDMFKDLKKIH